MPRPPRLTIGTAVYDDFDGLYFTVQSLRLHQDLAGAEILVVDNAPGLPGGKAIQDFLRWVQGDARARYIAAGEIVGTSEPRDRVFREAQGDVVLCLDSHVLLEPGAITGLVQWFADRPDSRDLVGGPLVFDNLTGLATHFDDRWRGEMWGTWGRAWSCFCGEARFSVVDLEGGKAAVCPLEPGGVDRPLSVCPECGLEYPALDFAGHEPRLESLGCWRLARERSEPAFEVPAQGLGLFAMRREAWPGFNPHFRGFGGEEFYLHEKVRQAGGKTLCLPFLRWVHRFGRPHGVKYPLTRWNKVRNYVLGHRELGLPLDRLRAHFVGAGLFSEEDWRRLLADPEKHVAPLHKPSGCGGCPGAAAVPTETTLEQLYERVWKTPGELNEHVPKLRELAGRCRRVTEFGGGRGASTTALLAAQPDRLVSYDLHRDPIVDALQARQGRTVYRFVQADVLQAPVIDETDLLFIDTKHTADQLWGELDRHAAEVRRYIVLHDTQLYGEQGADGGPGLLPALRRFLRAKPEWSVLYHSAANHGLTVIGRDPRDKPPLPGTITMAANFAAALAAHVADGLEKAAAAVLQARLETCTLCDQRRDDRCAMCGCYIAVKAQWASSECPLGKWPAAGDDPGTEQGALSREHGAGSTEQGAGSRGQGTPCSVLPAPCP